MAKSFRCTECGCVDIDISTEQDQELCYQCMHGDWHGLFEREDFDDDLHDSSYEPADDLGDHSFS